MSFKNASQSVNACVQCSSQSKLAVELVDFAMFIALKKTKYSLRRSPYSDTYIAHMVNCVVTQIRRLHIGYYVSIYLWLAI